MRQKIRCIPIFVLLICAAFTANAQCVEGDCVNGIGKYKFPSGSIYKGEFKNGQFHGYGICEYRDGDKYEGWWVERLPDGMGTLIKADGSTIEGLWKGGTLVDEAGTVLNTEFAEKTVGEGEIQTGCLKGDCRNGFGIMGFPDGTRYEGSFVNGKFHGPGKWFYTNGDVFDGNWYENFSHGKGRILHRNSTITQGIWEYGVFLGETADRTVRDCTHGGCGNLKEGSYLYSDGTKYVGEIKNGIPEGWGRVQYPSGEIYEGDWKNHIANGYGTYYTTQGEEYTGLWENGNFVSYGTVPEESSEMGGNETTGALLNNNGKSKVWAVIVGVSMYSHMKPLKYSDNDAFRLMAFLQSPAGGALPDEQIRVLVDEDATKDNIMNSMKELYGKANKNDLIILYFSGHGLKGSFLPIDYDGFNNKLFHDDINGLFESSKAKYKLCIADACHSGSYSMVAKGDIEDIISDYYTTLAQSQPGTALMLSSKPEETSLESLKVRQGVFSHYLLRGMKGEADMDGDGIVGLQELYDYISDEVKEYTQFRQSPVLKGDYDGEMPVSVVRK